MERRTAAVVGAGTAGAAAALLLARQGYEVTLFERVPQPGAVGAGIILQPSGMAVLSKLGLLGPVLARGSPLRGLTCQTASGWPVVTLSYEHLGPGQFGLGLHRGVLFDALFGAVKATAGVHLRLGVEAHAVVQRDGAAWLEAEGGAPLGGPYALVVVADGARSKLRQGSPLVRRASRYPFGALWFVAEDPGALFEGELFQTVAGTRRLYGLLPTGLGPEGETPLVSVFWSLAVAELESFRGLPLEAWKTEARALAPKSVPLLEQIRSHDDLLFSEYSDVVLSRWNDGRVVFLGDAAHATSPQLGQGCNLALCDAQGLAAALATDVPLPEALAKYSELRRAHLGWYQLATRWLTPFFQSNWRWLGPPRDLAFGLACRLPWVRRLMLESMAGVSLGPLRRALPLPELAALPAGEPRHSGSA